MEVDSGDIDEVVTSIRVASECSDDVEKGKAALEKALVIMEGDLPASVSHIPQHDGSQRDLTQNLQVPTIKPEKKPPMLSNAHSPTQHQPGVVPLLSGLLRGSLGALLPKNPLKQSWRTSKPSGDSILNSPFSSCDPAPPTRTQTPWPTRRGSPQRNGHASQLMALATVSFSRGFSPERWHRRLPATAVVQRCRIATAQRLACSWRGASRHPLSI